MIRRLLIALGLLIACASPALAVCPTDHYGAIICADSPSHWWRMNASSGTSETDQGPGVGGLNATYAGDFTLSQTGILGAGTGQHAVAFNNTLTTGVATTAGADASGAPDTTLNAKWAAEVWVKFNALPSSGNQMSFFAQATSSSQLSWRLGEINNGGTQEWVQATTNNSAGCNGTSYGITLPSSPTPATGTYWYVVMATVGAGGGNLSHQLFYVNASQISDVTSFTGSFSGCGGFLMGIGAIGSAPLWPSTATIDEAAVYTGGLTPTQITAHYNAGIFNPATSWPYTVKRDTLRPNKLAPSMPVVFVDMPAFIVDRLNAKAIRTPSQYDKR